LRVILFELLRSRTFGKKVNTEVYYIDSKKTIKGRKQKPPPAAATARRKRKGEGTRPSIGHTREGEREQPPGETRSPGASMSLAMRRER